MVKQLESFHTQLPNAVNVIKKTLEVPNQLHLVNQQIS